MVQTPASATKPSEAADNAAKKAAPHTRPIFKIEKRLKKNL